jgi:hypothetical protein
VLLFAGGGGDQGRERLARNGVEGMREKEILQIRWSVVCYYHPFQRAPVVVIILEVPEGGFVRWGGDGVTKEALQTLSRGIERIVGQVQKDLVVRGDRGVRFNLRRSFGV